MEKTTQALCISWRASDVNKSPSMEKKIMNPADICTTLRLPTRVNASKPAFSLFQKTNKVVY